jgi:histone arginine demethylase JMJD6
VGDDEDDRPVRLSIADYLEYAHGGAAADDNPLYLFEDTGSPAFSRVLGEYSVPKYFDKRNDLFSVLTEDERPPYRWLLLGSRRSGSAIHTDPLLTSAWNSSLHGRKRWLLFPPECRKVHLSPSALAELWPARLRGPSAWFEHVLPLVRSDGWRGSAPVEILQNPGETVYVPGGWWHVVLNLDDVAVAVTQNFAAVADFSSIKDIVWRKRGDIAEEWVSRVAVCWPELGCT